MNTVIKSVPLTFYSKSFYRQLLQQWRGIGMGFILLMVLVDVLVTGVTGAVGMTVVKDSFRNMADQLPAATFKDHKLFIDHPSPFVITEPPKDNKPDARPTRLVIDTGYAPIDLQTLSKKMQDENIIMFVTSDALYTMRSANHELKVQPLNNFPDLTITHEDWKKYAELTIAWGVPLIALFAAIGFFIIHMIKILFGAVIASIIGIFSKTVPDFGAAMRLAAAASIPSFILSIFLSRFGFIRFAIWVGYMIFGAYAARQQSE